MPPKSAPTQPETEPAEQATAAPDVPDAAETSPAPAASAGPGGMFVNVGSGVLEIPFTGIPAAPAVAVKPGRVVELACTPTHRDLKAATDHDIAASRAAEQAEAAAPAADTTPGQEP